MIDDGRLPPARTFVQLLVPFGVPYVLYTAIPALFPAAAQEAWLQGVRLAAVAAALVLYRRHYRLGPFTRSGFGWALAAAPVATLVWVGPLHVLRALTGASDVTGTASAAYVALRLVNSVVLAALAEELLMRVYVQQWGHQSHRQRRGRGFVASLMATLDDLPAPLTELPLSAPAVLLAAALFTLGHAPIEYPSAVLYFGFTTWLYRQTGSLWACVLVHAWTNLLVGGLVRYGGLAYLWF